MSEKANRLTAAFVELVAALEALQPEIFNPDYHSRNTHDLSETAAPALHNLRTLLAARQDGFRRPWSDVESVLFELEAIRIALSATQQSVETLLFHLNNHMQTRDMAAASTRFQKVRMARHKAGVEAQRSGKHPNPANIFTPTGDYERPVAQAAIDAASVAIQTGEPLPQEILFWFVRIIDAQMRFSKRSPFFLVLQRSGRREWAEETKSIAMTRYQLAVRDGRIKDKSPTKTLADEYCITRRRIQQILRNTESMRIVEDEDRSEFSPETIKRLMKQEAKRFRESTPVKATWKPRPQIRN